jgi:hypothetical protein
MKKVLYKLFHKDYLYFGISILCIIGMLVCDNSNYIISFGVTSIISFIVYFFIV